MSRTEGETALGNPNMHAMSMLVFRTDVFRAVVAYGRLTVALLPAAQSGPCPAGAALRSAEAFFMAICLPASTSIR